MNQATRRRRANGKGTNAFWAHFGFFIKQAIQCLIRKKDLMLLKDLIASMNTSEDYLLKRNQVIIEEIIKSIIVEELRVSALRECKKRGEVIISFLEQKDFQKWKSYKKNKKLFQPFSEEFDQYLEHVQRKMKVMIARQYFSEMENLQEVFTLNHERILDDRRFIYQKTRYVLREFFMGQKFIKDCPRIRFKLAP